MAEKKRGARCAERVWNTQMKRDWGCQHAAGYGEGAAYCKQHAKKHPSVNEVAAGVVKYWAEWEFSMPGLARVTVISETERTFTIGKATNLIGNVYFSATTKKDSGLLTDSLEAACEWITQAAALREARAEDALRRARKTAAEVQRMIEQVKASEVQKETK